MPSVGRYGTEYAALLKQMSESPEKLPAFMCHYYNFYFAHTAGGRMIGKKMAAMLLDNHELEFYKVRIGTDHEAAQSAAVLWC